MTKRRLALRGVLVLGALVAFLSLLCLDTVDYRPYIRAPYYAETMARLRAHSASNRIEIGQMEAGFGRARLTPTIDAPADEPLAGKFQALPLAGYGNRNGRPATGTHDDLYVKAVAVRIGSGLAIMFGADALIVPREVADAAAGQLQEELGLRREQLYLSATHTHCSLGGWGEGWVGEAFAGKFNPGVRIWFADRIVTATKEAIADLKPAEFGHGSFGANEFVRNRLVGNLGTIDPEFSYAVFKQVNGRMGVLGSYSAHATVLSGSVMEFSADYPGYWQRAVENATGGTAIFLAGAVGSHGPVPGDKAFKGAERMGQLLAKTTLENLPRTVFTNRLAFGLLGLEVSLPPFNTRITDSLRLRPWATARLLQADRPSFLQALRLGDSLWISTPCDFSGELALDIKNLFRLQRFHAVITSFNGDYIGYVIPARYYHLDGYEPRIMSFYGPNVPDYLDELIRTMSLLLISKPAPGG